MITEPDRVLRSFRRVQVSLVRETCAPYSRPRAIRSGLDVAALVRSIIGREPREIMLAVYLDGRHRTIGVHVVSIGTADQAPIHPREFFGPALTLGACSAIAAHNHPSGDATPSVTDRQVTERLREAGKLLGIEVLDHVVLGGDRFYSFADERFHPIPDTE